LEGEGLAKGVPVPPALGHTLGQRLALCSPFAFTGEALGNGAAGLSGKKTLAKG